MALLALAGSAILYYSLSFYQIGDNLLERKS